MEDLSDSDMHEIGACGGMWKPCDYCLEENADRQRVCAVDGGMLVKIGVSTHRDENLAIYRCANFPGCANTVYGEAFTPA